MPGGDGDGGGHDEHVAQRGDPPLVHAVVVPAELHLALVRGDLHQVRGALVGARLLRGARPHVADHACGCARQQVAAGQFSLSEEENKLEETGNNETIDRAGRCRFLTLFCVGEGHDEVRLLDPQHDLAALVRRRRHCVKLPLPCKARTLEFRMQSDDDVQVVASSIDSAAAGSPALTVRHRDEHLVALGQRRPGPRVVEVEVQVVLRQRRPRVLRPLVLAVPAAAGAAPSPQRRSATQCCDTPDSRQIQ